MKKTTWISFLCSLLISLSVLAQTEPASEKMPVYERMAKARAAKAERKITKADSQTALGAITTLNRNQVKSTQQNGSIKMDKATAKATTTPVKVLKGPNGEVVHTGEQGGKYYINKNGNKTYLSSNQ